MQMVRHANVELSTLALGPQDGAVTVLLHGLVSGNMAAWYSTLALPLSANRRVVLYDLRGHGSSSIPSQGFDLDHHVNDLCVVLEQRVGTEAQVDIVGHSLGALIGLHFALRYPERVRSLVLVDAPMPAKFWVAPSLLAAHSRAGVAAWIDAQPHLAQGATGRRRERLRHRVETLLFDTTLVSDVLAMEGACTHAMAAFSAPVLLIYGRQSPCLIAGYELSQALPTAQLRLVDAGHDVPIEAPLALRLAVEEFYSALTQSQMPVPGLGLQPWM